MNVYERNSRVLKPLLVGYKNAVPQHVFIIEAANNSATQNFWNCGQFQEKNSINELRKLLSGETVSQYQS